MAVTFENSYKGAAYPLDLTAEPYSLTAKSVKSLIDLCAEHITKDAQATLNAVKVLPANLCFSLMKAALQERRDRSIHVLITSWPFEVLTLKSMAPNLFASVLSLYNSSHQKKMYVLGARLASVIAHGFARCLQAKGDNMKLRYLDMTGFVAAEVITQLMASHCLLAYAKSRQKMVITMYEQVTKGMSDIISTNDDVSDYLPNGCYGVKLDVFINSVSTHADLCKALMVSEFKSSTFKLYINKLDATFLGDIKLKVLLDVINPVHLTALRLQFNSLGEHGILHLADSISRLTMLTSLDLSCNGIHFFHNQDSCDRVAGMLSSLPHLIRLDLSNNRIKTRLRQLLATLPQSLEYLAVAGCCLTVSDLTYLSLSHHVQGLRELDLSDNWCVGRHSHVFISLLQKLANKLMTLEIQNCGFGDTQVVGLLPLFPMLTQLCFLNLSCNEFCWNASESVIKTAASHPHIRALQMSYPRECDMYQEQDNLNNQSERARFVSEMTQLIQDHKSLTGYSFDLSMTD